MSKQEKLIALVKEALKKSGIVKAMFEEFCIPLDDIDNVSIEFSKLEVSAKTKDRKIYLNEKFLKDGEFLEDIHYIVHELCHYLQQTKNEVKDYEGLEDKSYLDKPTEIEAFQYQVQFMKDEYGDDVAKDYVKNLLDFHDIDGEEAEKKKLLLGG